MTLTACGGGSGGISPIIPGISHKIPVTLVNATDEQVSFYLRDKTGDIDSEDLFKSKYLVERLEANRTLNVKHKHDNLKPKIWLGAADSLTGNNRGKDKKTYSYSYNDDDELWGVAWKSGDNMHSDIFEKKTSNKDGYFRLRFLSTENTSITIDGTRTLLDGDEISDFYSIESCSESLKINDQAADICNATQGFSYLAIIDKNTLIKYIQEN